MKRYMVFAGPDYYPQGGMDDFVAYFSELKQAEMCAKKLEPWKVDWSQVYDTEKHEVVMRFQLNINGVPDFGPNEWYYRYPWEDEERAWIQKMINE